MDFPGNQPTIALQPYKGHFPHKLQVSPVGLGTSMTRVTIFPSHGAGHYSKPYLKFLSADAFELAKGKR